ncbi:MAG: bifunctional riboflavin kinase/FAD synthetase [Eubacterium sp.]|nr:bifunctional riboflavin kinase/FAD synthetase [Eubacterium sp.]
MQYITSSDFHLTDTAVALGKFEGIHRGHQLLLHEIIRQEDRQLKSVVFTFDMPPRFALSGDMGYQQLFTKEERHTILERMGIDVLIEYPFTRDFAALSPEEFVRDILVGKAGAKVVVVGTDFRFGKKRSGGVEDLERYSRDLGYELIVIDKLKEDHKDISSSRIRDLLMEGKMEDVTHLLGRGFSLAGPVIHGKALGRTINIPTANQQPEEGKLTPPNGVYVSRVHLGDEVCYGITNVGVKPTVDDSCKKGVETYIFDFDRDVYDQFIEVELLHYCRPEMRFESVDALKEQMQMDIQFGKSYVKGVDL